MRLIYRELLAVGIFLAVLALMIWLANLGF